MCSNCKVKAAWDTGRADTETFAITRPLAPSKNIATRKQKDFIQPLVAITKNAKLRDQGDSGVTNKRTSEQGSETETQTPEWFHKNDTLSG
jgi:hypothetical protein